MSQEHRSANVPGKGCQVIFHRGPMPRHATRQRSTWSRTRDLWLASLSVICRAVRRMVVNQIVSSLSKIETDPLTTKFLQSVDLHLRNVTFHPMCRVFAKRNDRHNDRHRAVCGFRTGHRQWGYRNPDAATCPCQRRRSLRAAQLS